MKAGNRTLLQSAGGNPLPAKEELPRGFDIAPFISLRPTSWSFNGRDLYLTIAQLDISSTLSQTRPQDFLSPISGDSTRPWWPVSRGGMFSDECDQPGDRNDSEGSTPS